MPLQHRGAGQPSSNNPLLFVLLIHLGYPGFALVDFTPGRFRPKEWSLLWLLMERSGALVTRGDILRHLWEDSVVEPAQIDTQLSNLRKTLGKTSAGRENLIITVPRQGYVLDLRPDQVVVLPQYARPVLARIAHHSH